MKFKVGDKVKVIVDKYMSIPFNSIVEVIKVNERINDTYYLCYKDRTVISLNFKEYELQKINTRLYRSGSNL